MTRTFYFRLDVKFNYSTEDGNAVAGSDYIAKSGQVTIAKDDTTATVDLEVIGDDVFEPNETFTLNLSEATGATFSNDLAESTLAVTIENDDTEESSGDSEDEFISLEGNEDDNNLVGGAGDEAIFGFEGNDTLVGNAGIDILLGGNDNDSLNGGDNEDFLSGDEGNDTLDGGKGDDNFVTGAGINSVDGGDGIDTVIYADVIYKGSNIPLNTTGNVVSVNDADTLTNVEFIQFSDVKVNTTTLEVVSSTPVDRINAGGDTYLDTLGQVWSQSEGFVNAGTFATQNAIVQTEDDTIYQSEHFGNNFSYQQSVLNGSYDVTLKFAEVFFNQAGKRVFDVSAEDELVLDDFDIFSEAGGKNIATDRTFTVDVNDGSLDLDFISSIDNAKVSAIEVKPILPSFYVNAGGEAYTDTSGQLWMQSSGFVGAGAFTRANPIAQTEDDILYQSEHFGDNFSYQQPVINGSYDVTLKFAEVFFNQAGQRVFDVSAENELVLDDFDIVESAGGKNIATDRTFTVDVNDGSLDLNFLGSIDKAKVSAIKIEPTPAIEIPRPTIRTNAGGNAYEDILNQSWLESSGFVGAGTFTRANAIAQTEDDVLYQSEAVGNNFSYQQEVANGSYDVTLKFAEVFFNNAGQRVFDVNLEGQTVLDDFDIVESSGGKNIAVDRTFNVNVTDGSIDLGFLSSVDKAKVSAIEIKPTLPQFRTNAGGGAYTDLGGQSWLESTGFVGAGTFTRANPIAQTEDDVLYQSEAFGNNFSYQQEVENGSYDVTLKFAEVFFNNPGQRVFDVEAEGQTVLDDFDIVESSGGKNIAVDRTFNVNVTDGSIDLGFLSSVDKAKVSAIEIKPNKPSFRTNAGGEAYADTSGQSWLESDGFVGAGTFSRANAIAQTEDDVLYQSEAVGNNFSYQQEVENGSYDVTLKFAEVFFNNPGQRVFDVEAEGQTVLDDFDIVESAGGKNIAVDRTFTVGVTDGTLDLDFIASMDNAKVSAIEIKPSLI